MPAKSARKNATSARGRASGTVLAKGKPKPPRAHRPARTAPHKKALETLLALTERLTRSMTLEESLQAVTDATLGLVPAEHASIRLLDTSNELLSGARSGQGSSRRPLSFRKGEGIIGWVVEHREGARVPDVHRDERWQTRESQGFEVRSMVAEPLWSAGQVIGVLSVSSSRAGAFSSDDELLVRLVANCSAPPIERARLRRLAMTDDLTLAYNTRYLSPRFNEEIERARRTGQPLSVLLMDLDHFKRVNDTHGHAVGDVVLRMFADRVRALVRRIDIFIRRGGEEFVLVMPSTTLEQARTTAERIRARIAERPLDVADGVAIRQTVSIGVATWDGHESAEALERRADEAMYAAKRAGRDRVAIAAPVLRSLSPLPRPTG
jgi:diguanylate cyclase (GGDEF)-like protein